MIRLSIGNSRMEKHWNLVEMELSEFRDRISHTRRRSARVTVKKFGKTFGLDEKSSSAAFCRK